MLTGHRKAIVPNMYQPHPVALMKKEPDYGPECRRLGSGVPCQNLVAKPDAVDGISPSWRSHERPRQEAIWLFLLLRFEIDLELAVFIVRQSDYVLDECILHPFLFDK